MSTPRLQEWIHRLEVGAGARVIQYFMLTLLLVGLVFVYDLRSYRGFNSPEAMDVAQVARNLADGNGYSTDFIRPFSIYLVQQRNLAATAGTTTATNLPADPARLRSPHPDLANPPVYPTVLAGLMKVWPQNWAAETGKPFLVHQWPVHPLSAGVLHCHLKPDPAAGGGRADVHAGQKTV